MSHRQISVPSGVPSWESDEGAKECCICHNQFSIFFRRHHCRKCGRVVCGNCSTSRSTYLPTTYVVSPPSQIFLESPHVPHRTCDECMEELEMIRAALRGSRYVGRDSRRQDATNQGSTGNGRTSNQGSRSSVASAGSSSSSQHRYIDDDTLIQNVGIDREEDKHNCPICGRSLKNLDETAQEEHVNDCLNREKARSERRPNRMIISQLSESEVQGLGECLICFEDFAQGDRVGRLECLCVYHEKCILDWFLRKGAGACPVHTMSYD